MKWAGHADLWGEEKCIQCFGGKATGKKPQEDRRRRENNIIIDPREIGWDGMWWIRLTQDRDQWRAPINKVLNLRVP
jgi:hypothetical protein